jgi:hypothetical protein
LSRIPPNLLLIRSLSRLLICWSLITPSVAWVTTQVPRKTADNKELEGYDDAVKDSYDLAYYNIVAGVCFAIALKYAGSADHEAETTLIHYYDAFSKTANQQGLLRTYAERHQANFSNSTDLRRTNQTFGGPRFFKFTIPLRGHGHVWNRRIERT